MKAELSENSEHIPLNGFLSISLAHQEKTGNRSFKREFPPLLLLALLRLHTEYSNIKIFRNIITLSDSYGLKKKKKK